MLQLKFLAVYDIMQLGEHTERRIIDMTVGSINGVGRVQDIGTVVNAKQPSLLSPAARSHNIIGLLYNADGDSAEISIKARSLFRNMNADFDLPSPFIDWKGVPSDPNSPGLQPPVTVSPPGVPSLGAPAGAAGPGESGPAAEASASLEALKPRGECKTCESRRYVDKSDDPSVSFQTPTSISANQSMAAVASHENEHVSNERAKAHRDGREIINQTVNLTYACCPECGRSYVSGGTTRTTSVGKADSGEDDKNGLPPGDENQEEK